jgi:hypothetical protein
MPSYISNKVPFNTAEQFKESFSEFTPTIGYVFIGNHIPNENDDVVADITESVSTDKQVWDNMYAAKKVTGFDVELVAPKVTWTANSKYRQFDDIKDPDDLLSANTAQNLKPVYVINTERNVYLCLCNNVSSNSTVEPSGKNLSSNGNIQTADGYLWKYLYNIRASNKFLTPDWIPAPISTSKLDFDTSSLISVDGELAKIVVTNNGSGYVHSNITVSAFTTGTNRLTVANTTNLSANMALTGIGIAGGTYITAIDNLNLRITMSANTTANGGGSASANAISVRTRIEINGDGFGAIGEPRLSGNTIEKITLTTYGRDYTTANIRIFGTGSGATARAVLPPKFGHGYNAAKQLGASNVMVAIRIGEIDSTEDGLISTDTTFRQYGLMRDPHKYGANTVVASTNANTIISQTTDLTIISGSNYVLNEFVYQGLTANTATFSGFVNSQDSNIVRLTRVNGTPVIGGPLKGTTSNPTGRAVVVVKNPEFEPYTGDILYVENVARTERTDGQAENIKFVVRF